MWLVDVVSGVVVDVVSGDLWLVCMFSGSG